MKKNKTKKDPVIAILEAGNGFTKKMKLDDFVPRLNIPFTHRVNINSIALNDLIHFDAHMGVDFRCYKRTKKTAWYEIENVGKISML